MTELESNFWDPVDGDRKLLVNFKTQLYFLLRWKWVGPSWMKILILMCWDHFYPLNYTAALTLSLFLKLLLRILEPWFIMKFHSCNVILYSTNLPSGLAWNTLVIVGLMLLIAAWIHWIDCWNHHIDSWSYTNWFSWKYSQSQSLL